MAQRRWQCPRCGSGLLGPGRMRRDDTRRFCLSCSADTGRLVERVCPALEHKREQAKAGRAERASAQRVAERARREEREVIDGVNVGQEIARLIRLPALRDELPGYLRDRPVEWTLDRSSNGRYSGRAWPRARIHLTLGNVPASQVKAIIAHELAHYVLPGVHHDGRWARCYTRVVREAYGVDIVARHGDSKYDLDARVIAALNTAR